MLFSSTYLKIPLPFPLMSTFVESPIEADNIASVTILTCTLEGVALKCCLQFLLVLLQVPGYHPARENKSWVSDWQSQNGSFAFATCWAHACIWRLVRFVFQQCTFILSWMWMVVEPKSSYPQGEGNRVDLHSHSVLHTHWLFWELGRGREGWMLLRYHTLNH